MAQPPSTPNRGVPSRRPLRPLLLAGAAAAALLLPAASGLAPAAAQGTAPPAAEQQFARGAQQAFTRARAAQERGDLRTAQIEYRNAVRADPASGFLRNALASISLDMGDTDTAEKEARAALERNFDPPGSTALLMRALLGRGRGATILNEFPLPTDDSTPPAVVAQIGAARVAASLASGDRTGARAELTALRRAAPNQPETHLAAATLAAVEGNRAEIAASVDRALAANPDHPDALLRKAALQLEQNERAAALSTLDRLIARAPSQVQARVLRGEALMREGNLARAKEDVEAALRVSPGSVPALYLRALLQVRDQEWRPADETLTRLGPALSNLPDGLLLLATVKRQIRQTEQALDAAQRYVSRRPEDPRGAKLLAIMELEQRQPAAAAGTLERLVQRGTADAEAYDILARALMQAGRPREAAEAMTKVVEQAPNDAGARTRLAAARLATGDTAGAAQAAQEALRLSANQPSAREILIVASLARGDIATAEAELARLPAEARRSELASVADATLRIAKLDVAGGRAALEDVLKRFPESTGARLGLARIHARAGQADDAQRLLTEVPRRDPSNMEALGSLAVAAVGGGPRAAAARAALEAAHTAAPNAPAPALTLANVLMRTGEAERALTLLDNEGLRSGPLQRGAALHLMRSDANTILQRWPEAEAAARTAFADDPDNPITRRQLALAMTRNGDARGAEELLQAGLRRRPGDAILQQTLVALVRQARGLDAALAVADDLGRQRDALPAAATLRGDLLLAAQRPADAARAYAGVAHRRGVADGGRHRTGDRRARDLAAALAARHRGTQPAGAIRPAGRPHGGRGTSPRHGDRVGADRCGGAEQPGLGTDAARRHRQPGPRPQPGGAGLFPPALAGGRGHAGLGTGAQRRSAACPAAAARGGRGAAGGQSGAAGRGAGRARSRHGLPPCLRAACDR